MSQAAPSSVLRVCSSFADLSGSSSWPDPAAQPSGLRSAPCSCSRSAMRLLRFGLHAPAARISVKSGANGGSWRQVGAPRAARGCALTPQQSRATPTNPRNERIEALKQAGIPVRNSRDQWIQTTLVNSSNEFPRLIRELPAAVRWTGEATAELEPGRIWRVATSNFRHPPCLRSWAAIGPGRGCACRMCLSLAGISSLAAIWRLITTSYFSTGNRRQPYTPEPCWPRHTGHRCRWSKTSALCALATPIKLGYKLSKWVNPPPGDRHPGNAQRQHGRQGHRVFAAHSSGRKGSGHPSLPGLMPRPFLSLLLNLFLRSHDGADTRADSDPHREHFPDHQEGRLSKAMRCSSELVSKWR